MQIEPEQHLLAAGSEPVPAGLDRTRHDPPFAVAESANLQARKRRGQVRQLPGADQKRMVLVAGAIEQRQAGAAFDAFHDGLAPGRRDVSQGRARGHVAVVGSFQEPVEPLLAEIASVDSRAAPVGDGVTLSFPGHHQDGISFDVETLHQLHGVADRQHVGLGGLEHEKKRPDRAASIGPGVLRVRRADIDLQRVVLFESFRRHRADRTHAGAEQHQGPQSRQNLPLSSRIHIVAPSTHHRRKHLA